LFASILVDSDDVQPDQHPQPVVGADLRVEPLATLSTGEGILGLKAHAALLARLRRAGRSLSLKPKGSLNRRTAKRSLTRLHARIANIPKDATHWATRHTKTFAVMGVEDLTVRGLAQNRSLARSNMDGGLSAFRRQLTDEARLDGSQILAAGIFYPSSKTCSCCESVKTDLASSRRTFTCQDCQVEADRDVNAAINQEKPAARSAATACGEARSGPVRKSRVKRAPVQQDENTELKAA
jgi:putative transposase